MSDKGQQLSSKSRFKELYEDVHPKVHAKGIEIYKVARAGAEPLSLQGAVEELIGLSDSVLDILNEFIQHR
ncbi:hypothetical protein A3743_28405 [Oleiphilus sp. HI0072]|nr:hypothetical protein A3743_28405 [Oleiphilus sp. HI0072]